MSVFDRFINWTTYCEFKHGYWKRKSRVGQFFIWILKREEL